MRQQHRSPLEHRLDLLALRRALFPVGCEDRHLGAHVLRERPLAREEELELEQVAQPQRLLPDLVRGVGEVALRDVQQGQLGDRARHKVVDRVVAVERRFDVLVRRDLVNGLGPAGELGDDALAHQRREDRPEDGVLADLDALDFGQAACIDVLDQRADQRASLVVGDRALAAVEQRERCERRRRDRRDTVDAIEDLEGRRER